MASTSTVSQSASSTSGTPNTVVIVSVVVGVVVILLVGIIIFRRWYLRRRKVHPRRQNTLELRTNDKLTSDFYVGRDRFQMSSPLLDDRKRKEESDYTARHHAIYEPPHAPYDPPHRSEEKDHFKRGPADERSTSPGFPNPHSPTKVTLSRLVIPEFKPLAMMEVLDPSFSSSPTSEGVVGSSHVSATSSAATDSPESTYSQVPALTGRFSIVPPVPPIPDQYKSTVSDDRNAITRTNTRAIGLMLKERAKRLKPDTISHSPSPVSPIERSGSIKSTYSHIMDREDEKPSLKSRIAAQQRKKTLPIPQMEPLLEVPNSAISTSTTSSLPVTSWQFPAPPAPPAPTFYPTHAAAPLSSMSPEQRRTVDVPYADISPLKIPNPRDRDPPTGVEEMPPWSDRRVHFRPSAEKASDVSYPVTRFQSTYGEIDYHHY